MSARNFDVKGFGARLRKAREAAGMSRSELAVMSEIPNKTIEKFEYGTQEPSVSRLAVMAELLSVSQKWLVTGVEHPVSIESVGTVSKTDDDDGNLPSVETETDGMLQHLADARRSGFSDVWRESVRSILGYLKRARAAQFAGCQRQALALCELAADNMKFMELEDLKGFAQEYGIIVFDEDTKIQTRKQKKHNGLIVRHSDREAVRDVEDIHAESVEIAERIIDKAVLGLDLYSIEQKKLQRLAKYVRERWPEIDAKRMGGLSWGDPKDFVPDIRPKVRLEMIETGALSLIGRESARSR
jgi:transcriptional regulator with XRE-family HTH domain